MDGLTYLRALLRSWWIVLIAVIAGGAGGYLVFHRATPLYASTVTMIVASDGSQLDEIATRQLTTLRAQTLAQVAGTNPAVAAAVKSASRGSGGSLAVDAQSSSSFVSVRVVNSSATVARDIAAAFPSTLPASLTRLAGSSGSDFSLNTVTPPEVAADPFSPDRNRDVGLGLAAGLVIGLALAALRETLNRSVRHGEDAHEVTGLPILGTVPRLTPKVLLPAMSDPRGARTEAYRQIRTTLLSQVEARPLTVAVTSATLGEGKTSVSCNLAVVLSRAGHRVALVDADMRRPQVATFFGIDGDPGLSDVLNGTADLDSTLHVLDEGRLAVLPSGRTPGNPAELLAGDRMATLLDRLRDVAEIVVVDTPPVLPVTDARELAGHVDGVVVVVKLGGPSRDRVRRAVAALGRVNATMVGVVPNQAGRDVDRDYRYSYRYSPTRRRTSSKTPTDRRSGTAPRNTGR